MLQKGAESFPLIVAGAQSGNGNLDRCGGTHAYPVACQFAGQRLVRGFTFKIEVMLSGVPSRAKAEAERSRSIPREHHCLPAARPAFHGILRLRAAPSSPSRRLLRMTSDFVKQSDKQQWHSEKVTGDTKPLILPHRCRRTITSRASPARRRFRRSPCIDRARI